MTKCITLKGVFIETESCSDTKRVSQSVSWTDGKCTMPTSCPVSECRSRTFTPRRNHLFTETIDWQTIRYVMCEADLLFSQHSILCLHLMAHRV